MMADRWRNRLSMPRVTCWARKNFFRCSTRTGTSVRFCSKAFCNSKTALNLLALLELLSEVKSLEVEQVEVARCCLKLLIRLKKDFHILKSNLGDCCCCCCLDMAALVRLRARRMDKLCAKIRILREKYWNFVSRILHTQEFYIHKIKILKQK